MNILLRIVLALMCFVSTSQAKEIALTIDDLPFVGSTQNKPHKIKRENARFKKMLQALKQHNIPATGFVIAGTIEQGQWDLLQEFHDAGFVVANHTFNHLNLNRTHAQRYIDNIEKADARLEPLLTNTKFFRYPYLATGRGQRKKQVEDYLAAKNYIIAPVTIDSKDFQFNQSLYRIPYSIRKYEKNLGRFKARYLGYIWRQTLRAEKRAKKAGINNAKQILLLHANLVNSFFLDDIIQMYKNKGYTFISLKQALKAPAPELSP